MKLGCFGFKMLSLVSFFSADISALFIALQNFKRMFSLTKDIYTFWKLEFGFLYSTLLMHECRQFYYDLMRNGIKLKFMWIRSHYKNWFVAWHEALNYSIFDEQLSPCNVQTDSAKKMAEKLRLDRHWFAYSMFPKLSFCP
jgi:hypothetical protein